MSNVQERRIYKRIEKQYTARLRVKQYKGSEISFAEWDMISRQLLNEPVHRPDEDRNNPDDQYSHTPTRYRLPI